MAVTLNAEKLRSQLGLSAKPTQSELGRGAVDRAVDLLAVATEMVEGFAGSAPESVQNEAVFRLASWLHLRSAGAPSSIRAGGLTLNWRQTPGVNAMRLSGAAGLLSTWRKPSVRVIK